MTRCVRSAELAGIVMARDVAVDGRSRLSYPATAVAITTLGYVLGSCVTYLTSLGIPLQPRMIYECSAVHECVGVWCRHARDMAHTRHDMPHSHYNICFLWASGPSRKTKEERVCATECFVFSDSTQL